MSLIVAPSYLFGGVEKRQKFSSNPLDQSISFEQDEAAMLVELCITPVVLFFLFNLHLAQKCWVSGFPTQPFLLGAVFISISVSMISLSLNCAFLLTFLSILIWVLMSQCDSLDLAHILSSLRLKLFSLAGFGITNLPIKQDKF